MQAFFAAAERALDPVTIAVASGGVYPNCPVLAQLVILIERKGDVT